MPFHKATTGAKNNTYALQQIGTMAQPLGLLDLNAELKTALTGMPQGPDKIDLTALCLAMKVEANSAFGICGKDLTALKLVLERTEKSRKAVSLTGEAGTLWTKHLPSVVDLCIWPQILQRAIIVQTGLGRGPSDGPKGLLSSAVCCVLLVATGACQ